MKRVRVLDLTRPLVICIQSWNTVTPQDLDVTTVIKFGNKAVSVALQAEQMTH